MGNICCGESGSKNNTSSYSPAKTNHNPSSVINSSNNHENNSTQNRKSKEVDDMCDSVEKQKTSSRPTINSNLDTDNKSTNLSQPVAKRERSLPTGDSLLISRRRSSSHHPHFASKEEEVPEIELMDNSPNSNSFNCESEYRFLASNRYRFMGPSKQNILFENNELKKRKLSQQADDKHPSGLRAAPSGTEIEEQMPHQVIEKPSARSENEDELAKLMVLAPKEQPLAPKPAPLQNDVKP